MNEINYDTEIYKKIKKSLKDLVKEEKEVNNLFNKGCEYINTQIRKDSRLKEIYEDKDNLEFIYATFTLIRDTELRSDKSMEKVYKGKSKAYYKNLPD